MRSKALSRGAALVDGRRINHDKSCYIIGWVMRGCSSWMVVNVYQRSPTTSERWDYHPTTELLTSWLYRGLHRLSVSGCGCCFWGELSEILVPCHYESLLYVGAYFDLTTHVLEHINDTC